MFRSKTKSKRKYIRTTLYKRQYRRQRHRAHIQRLGWHKKWRHWRYKNTSLLLVSLICVFLLASTDGVKDLILRLGNTGYIGAFIMGIFFVSVFTAVPAGIVLFALADTLHPIEVALLAGAGGVVGDLVLYRYIKNTVFDELKPLFSRITTHKLTKLFYTPYFGFLLPIVGFIIIASPGPDEVGVSLLGMSKIKEWQFMLITFFLNSLGILLIVMLAKAN